MKKSLLSVVCLFLSLFLNAQNNTFESELVEAKKGNVKSQSFVAGCYMYGIHGASVNYDEAVKWARTAAEKGDDYAQYLLGYAYYGGFGVVIDDRLSMEWYEKSAKQGRFSAQNNLATSYIRVEQNYNKALEWYLKGVTNEKLAIESGRYRGPFKDSYRYYIGMCYFRQKKYKEAFKCFESEFQKHDGATYVYSLLAMEYCYRNGLGVKKSKKKSNKLMKALIEQESGMIENIEGQYYALWGIETDYGMAKLNYECAIRHGNATGNYGLALLYMNGLGVEVDHEKAKECWSGYLKSKKNENNDISYKRALHNLAICDYNIGERLYKEKKYKKAFELLNEAATNQFNPIPQAMRLLSAFYRYGHGDVVKKDSQKEKYWRKEAARHNDAKALKILKGF